MKTALKIIFIFSLSTPIFATTYQSIAADQDCFDNNLFPTVPTKCTCVMNNAVNDCLQNSPIKSMCNIPGLSNLFKSNPNLANAECQHYGGTPTQCAASISFFDQNC